MLARNGLHGVAGVCQFPRNYATGVARGSDHGKPARVLSHFHSLSWLGTGSLRGRRSIQARKGSITPIVAMKTPHTWLNLRPTRTSHALIRCAIPATNISVMNSNPAKVPAITKN